MASDDNDNAESARAGAYQIVEHAPKVLAGLAGLVGAAYLAGSVYTKAYFAEFGASWILEEIPTAIYFSQSWIPLLLIVFIGYLAATNLAQIESPSNLTASTRFKVSVAIVRYGPYFLLVLFAITSLLSASDCIVAAIVLSVIAVTLILLLLSSALELLVARISVGDRHTDLSMTYLSFAVIAAGLYVVPAQLGINWARIDKHSSSTLPTVYLPGDKETEYKLLFAADERLYVFPIRYEGNHPPISAAAAADVRFVPHESQSD